MLHNVTDIPLEEIKDDSTLDDLGIDSLMATELLNDVRATFGVTIDLTTLLFFPNMRAAWGHLDSKLGISPAVNPTPQQYKQVSAQDREVTGVGENRWDEPPSNQAAEKQKVTSPQAQPVRYRFQINQQFLEEEAKNEETRTFQKLYQRFGDLVVFGSGRAAWE